MDILPRTLDETYERILAPIEQVDEVKTALQWITFSDRPLTVRELNEACITNFQSKPYLDVKSRDAMDGLIDVLSSLIRVETQIQEDGFYEITPDCRVFLAHFSVKEYLLHDRISASSASCFALEAHLSHYSLAQSGVAYLLAYHEARDYANTKDADLLAFPLLHYSARCWFIHQRYVESSSCIITGQVNLHYNLLSFDGAKKSWLSIYNPDRSHENGEALYWASSLGLVKTVSHFSNLGVEANSGEGLHGYPLHAACYHGYEEIVEMLLRAGAASDRMNSKGVSALPLAAHMDHEPVVRILLRCGTNVNAPGGLYGPALYAAISRNNFKIAELLLQEGADVNAQGGRWGTALCVASNGREKALKLLVPKGANLNAHGGEWGTALCVAAFFGREMALEFLIQEGANVNARIEGAQYSTALHAAVLNGRHECAKILLANGADVNLLPESRYTIFAACADLLIAYSTKNLRYRYWSHPTAVYIILTDEHGHPIRADGKWREDVPKGKLY